MNLRSRLTVLAFALLCAARPGAAQITITASDVTATLAVGHSTTSEIDKMTTTLNIGVKGSTSWDFSKVRSDSSQTLTSVAVGGTPFASDYPSATHAFQTNLNVVVGMGVLPAVGYIYFQLSTNLLNLGESANIASGALTLIGNNVPTAIFYGLPSTFGTAWTTSYLDTSTIFLGGVSFFSASGTRHRSGFVVDAYGPMMLPDTTVHQALRIKKTDTVTTTNGTAIAVSYIFLARDAASVLATALNTSQNDTGTIQVQPLSISWNKQVIALPIQLATFNAAPDPGGNGVHLTWMTKSETNNYGFEVQRGADPSGTFATLPGGFIPGHGTTIVQQNYAFTDRNAPPGVSYYRLKQMDLDGAIHYSDAVRVLVSPDVSPGNTPVQWRLDQNYPNPFNPATTIRYALPAASEMTLAVYNSLGEKVAQIAGGRQEAGEHTVTFDGSALASGVYFCRLEAPGVLLVKKLTLLR